MIAAVAENRVIGNKNTIPWNFPPYKMAADFKYFKETTFGKTIVMGLNTFNSIGGKPLPGRKHIILNNDLNYVAPEDCVIAHSIEEVLELGKDLTAQAGVDELMICGGASVYKQFLPLSRKLYLTYVHVSPEGDTYFPEVNLAEWKEMSREDFKADDPSTDSGQVNNSFDYSFVILERI